MRERRVGSRNAGHVGLGVQMIGASTTLSIVDAVALIHRALEAGVRFLDTADVYAPNSFWTGQGERLVGEALRVWDGGRDSVLVATKGGHLLGSHPQDIRRNGRPEHLRGACEASLRRLGRDAIDLYQLHSVDPDVPLAESVGALADLRREGKIRMIGLSNVGRRQIAEAREVVEIAAVQNRLSVLDTRSRAIADWCGEGGVAFLPYSPLGRSEAGQIGERLDVLARIAHRHGCSPQRVALAWLIGLGDHVLPLPGATKVANILDNVAAAELQLTEQDSLEIEAAISASAA